MYSIVALLVPLSDGIIYKCREKTRGMFRLQTYAIWYIMPIDIIMALNRISLGRPYVKTIVFCSDIIFLFT
jgi:hypothetical protein